jgi:hypothetical protein
MYLLSTQDKPFICRDDPKCKFQSCDPAALLRHRKRLHGYTPRSSDQSNSVEKKAEKPCRLPVRVVRGIEGDPSIVASQFNRFKFSPAPEASNSGSSSKWPSLSPAPSSSLLPSPTWSTPTTSPSLSLSPSPPPFGSHPPPSRYHSYSPTDYSGSGESEVSLPTTPVASTSHHQLTSETSSVVYPTASDNSLLFAPPYDPYGSTLVHHPFASNFVDSSPGSQIRYPKEMIYDGTPITTGDEWKFFPLPPLNFDADTESAGFLMTAMDHLDYEEQQPSSFNTAEVDYLVNGGPSFHSHISPIEVVYQNPSGVDSDVFEWFEWAFSTGDPSYARNS